MNKIDLLQFETKKIDADLYMFWNSQAETVKKFIQLIYQTGEEIDLDEAISLLNKIEEIEDSYTAGEIYLRNNILDYLSTMKAILIELTIELDDDSWDEEEQDNTNDELSENELNIQENEIFFEKLCEVFDLNSEERYENYAKTLKVFFIKEKIREILDQICPERPSFGSIQFKHDISQLVFSHGFDIHEVSDHFNVRVDTIERWHDEIDPSKI